MTGGNEINDSGLFEDDWYATLNMGIDEVRALYSIISYAYETWPGAPRRPYEEQEYLRGLYCLFKYKNNTMMHLEDDDPELEVMDSHVGTIRKLVDIHPHTGEEYIYFSYHFIQKVIQNGKAGELH